MSQDLSGRVKIAAKSRRKLTHEGLDLALIGEVQVFNNNSRSFEFLNITKRLSGPETIFGKKVCPPVDL